MDFIISEYKNGEWNERETIINKTPEDAMQALLEKDNFENFRAISTDAIKAVHVRTIEVNGKSELLITGEYKPLYTLAYDMCKNRKMDIDFKVLYSDIHFKFKYDTKINKPIKF